MRSPTIRPRSASGCAEPHVSVRELTHTLYTDGPFAPLLDGIRRAFHLHNKHRAPSTKKALLDAIVSWRLREFTLPSLV